MYVPTIFAISGKKGPMDNINVNVSDNSKKCLSVTHGYVLGYVSLFTSTTKYTKSISYLQKQGL